MNDMAAIEACSDADLLRAAETALVDKDYSGVVRLTTEALEVMPSEKALAMRGAAYLLQQDYFASIIDNDRVLRLNGNSFAGLSNRGACYVALDLIEEAVADFTKAIELHPDRFESYLQLGIMYYYMGYSVEAEKYLRLAAARGSPYRITYVPLAIVLKGLGKWEEGFALDRRVRTRTSLDAYWNGEDLAGKHLYLFLEDGQGDRILALRYLDTLAKAYPTAKLSIGVQDNFRRLVASSFPSVQITDQIEADYICSICDMPLLLKMDWKTAPRPSRYLDVDWMLITRWAARLRNLSRGMNVGICWMSMSREGKTKFIPDDALECLGHVNGVNFISLQVPTRKCSLAVHDWTAELKDWADTAALIECLDLVISTDTAVAHLAGALGKPVWTIVRNSSLWPWMASHVPPSPSYSVWYPTMRLFRQQTDDDMTPPINRVMLELRRLVS